MTYFKDYALARVFIGFSNDGITAKKLNGIEPLTCGTWFKVNFVYPIIKPGLFSTFACLLPFALGVAGTATAAYFFSDFIEKSWKKLIGNIISDEMLLKGISVSSVVLASFLAGFIFQVIIQNIIGAIAAPDWDKIQIEK